HYLRVEAAIAGLAVLSQGEQSPSGDLTRWPLSAFIPIIHDLLEIIRALDRESAGSGFDFLVRPPGPANVVSLDQRDTIPKPLITILAAFPQPNRQVMLFTQSQEASDLFLRVRIPVLVKADYEVFVPSTRKAVVVVPPGVPFDDDKMVPVRFANRPGDGSIE